MADLLALRLKAIPDHYMYVIRGLCQELNHNKTPKPKPQNSASEGWQ